AAAHHFFLALRRGDALALSHGARLLARLSAVSAAAAKAVLAQLVEGALRGRNAELFGGTVEPPAGTEEPPGEPGGAGVSLLDTNRRFSAAVNSAGGVWSVFHAGVIGRGLKPAGGAERRDPEEFARNAHTFLSLLLRCCRGSRPGEPEPGVSPEAAKAVAAALVESVCPEAAGGDLAWPPEEQARGTVERDLRICRRFR
ncbi:INT5 protein, partial [Xiphorhynchus elegans]|nr:INT5 protein [Xiphorhynchus elegans]